MFFNFRLFWIIQFLVNVFIFFFFQSPRKISSRCQTHNDIFNIQLFLADSGFVHFFFIFVFQPSGRILFLCRQFKVIFITPECFLVNIDYNDLRLSFFHFQWWYFLHWMLNVEYLDFFEYFLDLSRLRIYLWFECWFFGVMTFVLDQCRSIKSLDWILRRSE